MYDQVTRSGLAAIGTIVTYYVGNLTPLFYLMVGFAASDYIAGMAAAKWYSHNAEEAWNSTKAVQGFVKKVAYIFLVGVAWGIDFLILEIHQEVHLQLDWSPFFGVFAMCYLILTEAISIMENAQKMGIEIPFLTSALKSFREKVSPPHNKNNKL